MLMPAAPSPLELAPTTRMRVWEVESSFSALISVSAVKGILLRVSSTLTISKSALWPMAVRMAGLPANAVDCWAKAEPRTATKRAQMSIDRFMKNLPFIVRI